MIIFFTFKLHKMENFRYPKLHKMESFRHYKLHKMESFPSFPAILPLIICKLFPPIFAHYAKKL